MKNYFSFSESDYVVDINGGSFTSSVPADFSINLSAGSVKKKKLIFVIFSSFCILNQMLFSTHSLSSSKGLTYTFLADHENNYDQYKITLGSRNYVTFQVKLCNDAYIMLEDTAGVWRVWQLSFNIC